MKPLDHLQRTRAEATHSASLPETLAKDLRTILTPPAPVSEPVSEPHAAITIEPSVVPPKVRTEKQIAATQRMLAAAAAKRGTTV